MLPTDTEDLSITRQEISTITTNPRAAKAVESLFQLAQLSPEAVNEATETAEAAAGAAADAASDAAAAQGTADAIAAAQFVVLALSSALSNERVLGGGPGVGIDLTTPGQVNITVNVVTALGYTPANKAGDTFSGAVDVQAGLRCDSLRIDQAPAASVTAASHALAIDLNGTTYYLKLSATP